uniref:Crystaline entomocidal protoxin n=2 Tax=Bacillus thuringiensis TaxID=1428 RepID=A0A0X7YG64_BACTU|nr:Cry8Sa1 [Bacillus thuringiensis]
MSPNNQNEYDIIDASSRTSVSNDSVRYPLAEDPNAALQNMNYKEYLRMSGGDPEGFISIPTAIGTATSIIGGIADLLGIPGISFVGGFISTLLDLLWPPEPDPWELFMEQVEELINQRIETQVRNRALSELEGLSDLLKLYQNYFELWDNNKSNTRLLNNLRNQFQIVDNFFTQYMPIFRIAGNEVLLLTVYAQAANLHLLLLRDMSVYGEEWGVNPALIENYYNRQIQLTAQYTDHCVRWYNTGLEELRGTTAQQWVHFDRYRREMTLMVLDIIALFPSYDIRLYPQGTNTELTREIYTPVGTFVTEGGSLTTRVISWHDMRPPNFPSFSTIENTVVRSPALFTVLRELEISSMRRNEGSFTFYYYWSGQMTGHSNINDSSIRRIGGGDLTNDRANVPLNNRNVYRAIWNYIGRFGGSLLGVNPVDFFFTDNTQFTYERPRFGMGSGGQIRIDSGEEVPFESHTDYSHIVSSASSFPLWTNAGTRLGSVVTFGWTHSSVDLENTIHPERINQIPAVKAIQGSGRIFPVVRGPGFTGGDLAQMPVTGEGLWFNGRIEPDALNKAFRVRVRYATNGLIRLAFNIAGDQNQVLLFPSTMTNERVSRFEDFNYITFPGIFTFRSTNSSWFLRPEGNFIGNVYIDRIEFIPVDETFEAEQDLEKAKKAVNALFTNRKDALRAGVTDYQINQAANLIECVSNELYPNEKRMLLDAVKEAKRLSGARNLLQDAGFHMIYENGENGWTTSTGVEIVEGDVLFKGNSLRLSSAREIGTENYPTYLYQKIDETRLKPNTRYRLRGFIGSSQNLEIYVTRYQTQRVVKNVADNLLPDVYPVNDCGGVNRCSEQNYVNTVLEAENNVSIGNRSSDSHEFSIHVDTGEVNYNENTGIWIVFKITTTDGYATLGNLELVEEGPLSGDTLERVRKQEKQWQDQMARRRAETETRYGAAKQAIDRLFIDYQDQQLSPGTDISDLTAAQNVVQSIPYVYNDMLPEIPGMNYTSVTELTNRLQQAWDLYDQRNSIQNGDFRNDVSNWNVTPEVNIQQMNDTSVLVIPNWDSQASQQITVQPNRRYVLRVTARKEGNGDGYVTIRDGANHTETLTFNTCDYNGSSVYQEQAMYTNGQDTNDVYNTQSVNRNGSNSAYHTQAPNTNSYHTSGMYGDQTSYVTKTVEFIPHTEQVWIEMSETEGVFYIESVELIVEEN